MKKILWLTAMVILVGMMVQQAEAIIEPTPDMIGVYFDADANFVDVSVAPYTAFTAYFLLTNPLLTEIQGYEFGYHVDIDPINESFWVRTGYWFPSGIIIVGGNIDDPLDGEVLLEFPPPVATTAVTVLWTWDVLVGSELTAHITVGPVTTPYFGDGAPVYTDGTNVNQMVSTSCSGWVNAECSVAVEAMSFGAIKALYR